MPEIRFGLTRYFFTERSSRQRYIAENKKTFTTDSFEKIRAWIVADSSRFSASAEESFRAAVNEDFSDQYEKQFIRKRNRKKENKREKRNDKNTEKQKTRCKIRGLWHTFGCRTDDETAFASRRGRHHASRTWRQDTRTRRDDPLRRGSSKISRPGYRARRTTNTDQRPKTNDQNGAKRYHDRSRASWTSQTDEKGGCLDRWTISNISRTKWKPGPRDRTNLHK